MVCIVFLGASTSRRKKVLDGLALIKENQIQNQWKLGLYRGHIQ